MRIMKRWPFRSGCLLCACRRPSWLRSVPFGVGLCDKFHYVYLPASEVTSAQQLLR